MARTRSRRRWIIAACVVGIVGVWCVVAALSLASARRDAQSGLDTLQSVRDEMGATQLVRGVALDAVEDAREDFERAHDRSSSWVLTPFRFLPVIGRQVRSVDSLTGSAAKVADIGVTTMRESLRTIDEQPDGASGRVRLVETLGGIAETSGARLRSVDLGPDDALLAPLANARNEFSVELRQLRRAVADLGAASRGLAPVLRGPSRYLVFAANNAEMRAGSGMFLSVGVLTFENGSFSLSEMESTGNITLPPGAVPVTGDFAARWGWTDPNEEWRNLAMTPRFDASASLAVRMWKWRTGQDIDGVLAIDPFALQSLLAATGPITVDGQVIDQSNVVADALLNQYTASGSDDVAQAERKERLGDIARATVDALDAGGWDTATLVEQLRTAADGRHVLAWSDDPVQERGWKGIGIDGELRADSLLLAVLNRGGNKLDQFLDIRSHIEVAAGQDRTAVTVTVTLTNNTPSGLPRYVAGPFPGRSYPPGTYAGIFSLDVPGASRDISIDDGAPLVAAGPDGPARVVATDVLLQQGEQRELVIRFALPPGVRSVRVEPTARVPGVRWSDSSGDWADGESRIVRW